MSKDTTQWLKGSADLGVSVIRVQCHQLQHMMMARKAAQAVLPAEGIYLREYWEWGHARFNWRCSHIVRQLHGLKPPAEIACSNQQRCICTHRMQHFHKPAVVGPHGACCDARPTRQPARSTSAHPATTHCTVNSCCCCAALGAYDVHCDHHNALKGQGLSLRDCHLCGCARASVGTHTYKHTVIHTHSQLWRSQCGQQRP